MSDVDKLFILFNLFRQIPTLLATGFGYKYTKYLL